MWCESLMRKQGSTTARHKCERPEERRRRLLHRRRFITLHHTHESFDYISDYWHVREKCLHGRLAREEAEGTAARLAQRVTRDPPQTARQSRPTPR